MSQEDHQRLGEENERLRGEVARLEAALASCGQAEASLRESERRFRALTEKATDILYVVDAGFVVRHWSPGATEALGWQAGEAIGRFGLDFIHPDDVAQIVPPDPTAPPGATVRFSYRIMHRDGSYRHVEATVRNLLADPAVGGVVVNARDVTEQRQLEARWTEAQKLESIGRLAGGVAHDFNNLLTVILSCGELMQEAMAAGEQPLADDLREILSAGNRARELTQQLLAFARRQVIAPVVLDLNRLVSENERLLRRVLGEDVTLSIALDPAPCEVRCDPTQISQVILNLAVNARDAMPRGGRLEITTSRREARPGEGLEAGPHVRMTVRDDGPGFSPEARAHLFEPFFTTKPKGQGTGLGLATVHGIVHQSGGSIRVDSEPGRGARFEILLPGSEAAPPQAAATPEGRPRQGHEIVLLVEDDPGVGAVSARILREAGYQVLRAQHGAEAVEVARREPRVDLLVTDVVLPGIDGRQVADAVTEAHRGARVLFVSGYTQEAIGHHGVVDAGEQFLSKPFTPAALLARVRQALATPG